MSVAGPSGSMKTRLSTKSQCIPYHGAQCVGNADGVSEAQGCARLSGALHRSSVTSWPLPRCRQMPDGTTFTSRMAASPRSYCTLNIRLDRFGGVSIPGTIRRSIGSPYIATRANFGDRPHVEGCGPTLRVDEMPETPFDPLSPQTMVGGSSIVVPAVPISIGSDGRRQRRAQQRLVGVPFAGGIQRFEKLHAAGCEQRDRQPIPV